VDQFHHFI